MNIKPSAVEGIFIGFITFTVLFPTSVWMNTAVYDVKTYGAKGNGEILDTQAIQAAVDAAYSAGGGEVYFPEGIYKTVTIELKTKVSLNIPANVMILASTAAKDWALVDKKPIISANNAEEISINGNGIIDGGGLEFYRATGGVVAGYRPQQIIGFNKCKNITVNGIKLQNSVKWTMVFNQCANLVVDGVKVRNREYALNKETDGLDLNSCRHVVAKNLDIETGDDGICLKPQGNINKQPATKMYDILVENCTIASTCNATKIGTGTTEEIYDCIFRNITINKHSQVKEMMKGDNSTRSCIAAISIQSNDGGATHDIRFENYTINDCDTPIFLLLQNRQSYVQHSAIGKLYNIMLTGITCYKSQRSSQINTTVNGQINNIILENISIHNQETYSSKTSPPYPNGGYPDAWKYGRMPSYGLFARNINGLIFSGNVLFYDDGNSRRPKTVFENVINFKQKDPS